MLAKYPTFRSPAAGLVIGAMALLMVAGARTPAPPLPAAGPAANANRIDIAVALAGIAVRINVVTQRGGKAS